MEVNQSFETTRWTELLGVRTVDETRRRAVLGNLLSRYWHPVFTYLRYKGKKREDASDLTQGFFCDIILGKNLVQKAERSKGRFRTFMLTSLDRYVHNVHRHDTAKKRMPPEGIISLDGIDTELLFEPEGFGSAEEVFNYTWASVLLSQVLTEVESICLDSEKKIHWQVFQERILNPIINGSTPQSFSHLCAKYQIEDESKARNMVVTVKRRFQAALVRHLHQLVEKDKDIDREFYDLIDFLQKKSAKS